MEDINHLSIHQWLRSAINDSQQPISPIGFLFLKLPPPPCAVLLVYIYIHMYCTMAYAWCMQSVHYVFLVRSQIQLKPSETDLDWSHLGTLQTSPCTCERPPSHPENQFAKNMRFVKGGLSLKKNETSSYQKKSSRAASSHHLISQVVPQLAPFQLPLSPLAQVCCFQT